MFGLFKKKTHEVTVSITDSNAKSTFLRLHTHDKSLALQVVSAVLGKARVLHDTHTYADPNYEAWDKQTDAEDEAAASEERSSELLKDIRATEAPPEFKSIQHAVQVKQPTPEPSRKKTLPLLGSSQEGSGVALADRAGGDKLAELAASLEQVALGTRDSAPTMRMSEAPPNMKSSKVEEDGSITFRAKLDCPKCRRVSYRFKGVTNAYVKCRNCDSKLTLEAPSSETVYDGRLNQNVPAPDADGNHFHAYRLHDN